MVEYAYNNSTTTTTGATPFYANYGRHLESLNLRRTDVLHPVSRTYSHWILGAIEEARKALEAARKRMIQSADSKRKEPPAYSIGDAVMLSTRNLRIKRPSRKLDHGFLGPFQIGRVISPTPARLTLPQKWKTHPSFHVPELEPFISGSWPAPNFERVLRGVGDVGADEEFDVEIKGSIIRRKRVHYLVKWLGLPKKDWTFEPYENFSEGVRELLLEFHKKHPSAPKDYRLKESTATTSAMT